MTPASPNKKQMTKVNPAFRKIPLPEPFRRKTGRKSHLKVRKEREHWHQLTKTFTNIILTRPGLYSEVTNPLDTHRQRLILWIPVEDKTIQPDDR